MARGTERSLYDILEVDATASREEIEASYQRIISFLASESLAMYSMLDEHETQHVRSQLDGAYQTLTDPQTRAAYDKDRQTERNTPSAPVATEVRLVEPADATHEAELREPEVALSIEPAVVTTVTLIDRHETRRAPAQSASRSALAPRGVTTPDSARRRRLRPVATIDVGPDTEFSGSLLRRLRESAEATLDDVADITKISKRYLSALEENDFDTLPAFVYVRGFVSEYARALGLDARMVTQSYMSLYRRYHGESGG